MPSSKVAKFTSYGKTSATDKEVSLWKSPDGTYQVTIEGYEELTKGKNFTYDEAIDTLHAIRSMAERDWGHSDIEWLE